MAGTGIQAEASGRVSNVNQTAILKVLTPENRRLTALIFRHKPDSIGSLCKLAGRAQPNVSRALASLEEAGIVKMVGSFMVFQRLQPGAREEPRLVSATQ